MTKTDGNQGDAPHNCQLPRQLSTMSTMSTDWTASPTVVANTTTQSRTSVECPCHGSKFAATGKKLSGPAPQGMGRFAVLLKKGQLFIDTSKLHPPLPLGTRLTGDVALGPHCV